MHRMQRGQTGSYVSAPAASMTGQAGTCRNILGNIAMVVEFVLGSFSRCWMDDEECLHTLYLASNNTLWKMLVVRPSPPQVYNVRISVLGHEEMPSQYPFLMPQVSPKQQDASCVKGILTAGLHFSADQLALWQWRVWEGRWLPLVLWACSMRINWRILFSFINELLSVEQPRGRNGRFFCLMVSG